MPVVTYEYFVPEDEVREEILRRRLKSLFGDDAKCRHIWRDNEAGWLVQSTARVLVQDWLARLRAATRKWEAEERKRETTDAEQQKVQGRPDTQHEPRRRGERTDSYEASSKAQRGEKTYPRHGKDPNGEDATATVAGKAPTPIRTLSYTDGRAPKNQLVHEQHRLPRSTVLQHPIHPVRSSSLRRRSEKEEPIANTSRQVRPQDLRPNPALGGDYLGTSTRPLSLLRTSTTPLPTRMSSLPTDPKRRTSFGQGSVDRRDSRAGDPITQSNRPRISFPRREKARGLIDGPDDDEDDDTNIGHAGGPGRHEPVTAVRQLGREDDDDDDDDTFGHYYPRRHNAATMDIRHRGRDDDDDDSDDVIGHRTVKGRSTASIGARHRSREDDDEDKDDDRNSNAMGQYRAERRSAASSGPRHQGGDDDDDDDDDDVIGHKYQSTVPRSTALPPSAGAKMSTARAAPRHAARSIASSQASSRKSSVSNPSTLATSTGTLSEKGTGPGHTIARDRHIPQMPTRTRFAPSPILGHPVISGSHPQQLPPRTRAPSAPVPEADDSELSYTDDSEEEPRYGQPMEDSRRQDGKKYHEGTEKRSPQEKGRETVVVARTNSGRQRDPRYPNVYRR